MADEQKAPAGVVFDDAPPASNPQGSGTSQAPPGVVFDSTPVPDKAPLIGENHPLAQEVADKANRLQELIHNAPQEAMKALSKHLPAGFLQSEIPGAAGLTWEQVAGMQAASPGTQLTLDYAGSVPGVVGGAAEAQVASDKGDKFGVLKAAARTAGNIINLAAVPGEEAGAKAVAKSTGALSKGVDAAKRFLIPEEHALPPGASFEKLLKLSQSVPVPHPSEIQPEFQRGLQDIFDTVTRQHGAIPIADGGLEESLSGAVDSLSAQAKATYERIDKAMGGKKFQDLNATVEDLTEKLASAKDDARPAIRQQLEDAEETRQLYWQRALKNGKVTPADADAAEALYRRYRSMQDVQSTLRSSLKTAKNGSIGVADSRGVERFIDPGGFYDKLRLLEGKSRFGGSRVSTALGDQTERLFQHVADHQIAAKELATEGKAATKLNRENAAALDKYIDSVQNEIDRVEALNAAEKARVSANKRAVVKSVVRGAATAAGLGGIYEVAQKVSRMAGQ